MSETRKIDQAVLGDTFLLNSLKNSPAYQRLQAGWALQAKIIMAGMQKACMEKSNDHSMRYWAGQWNGFELAIGMLDRMISDAEKESKSPAQKVQDIINRRTV